MLPLLCVMDIIGLWAYRSRWDPRNLRILAGGGLLGLYLGYLSFRHLDEHYIRLMVGVIAVGFPLSIWLRRGASQRPADPSWVRGIFWSMLSGIASFVANAGGPPITVYLLPQRMDKAIFVGTLVIYFAAVNYLKIVPYWLLGQFSGENILTSLILMPLAPLGMWLGIWMNDKIEQRHFYTWCNAMLFIVGLKLLGDGVAPFF
jgi:hypothetical protein